MKPRVPFLLLKTIAILLFFKGITAHAQNDPLKKQVSLKGKNLPLGELLTQMKTQAGVVFFWTQDINIKETVTVHFAGKTVPYILDHLPLKQALVWEYQTQSGRITLKGYKPRAKPMISNAGSISGRVVDSAGEPLPETAINVKGNSKLIAVDQSGNFLLSNVAENSILEVSRIGYSKQEVIVKGPHLVIVLKQEEHILDETYVVAYGNTSRRKSTGSEGSIKSGEMEKQPVLNPLAMLEGRVAGLQVTQRNGSPGGAFDVLIRGLTSIGAVSSTLVKSHTSNTPLYVRNGVPFVAGSAFFDSNDESAFGNAVSPFTTLNPSDIQSIEVLKDADATAIFGSRGANGVILITTKKGVAGPVQTTLRLGSGYTRLNNQLQLMHTTPYLNMLREAFANDNKPIDANALLYFDPNRYTDFNKLLLQRPAWQSSAQLSLSFGDARTQFIANVGHAAETVTYAHVPGRNSFRVYRPSFHVNVNHSSANERFKINVDLLYATFRGTLTGSEPFAMATYFEPNHPAFIDANGKLVWEYNGATNLSNGYATLYNEYRGKPDNFSTGVNASYQLAEKWRLVTAMGFDSYVINESKLVPLKSKSPASNETNSATIRDASIKTYIIEPRVEYSAELGRGWLQVLCGFTLQQSRSISLSLTGSNFLPDDLYGFLASPNRNLKRIEGDYRYMAVYARANYNIRNTYIINLSANRDASSRFAPGKRYSNFGALGAAWVFKLPFLSFSKLKASAGITGNDGIGNYQYMSTFTSTATYQGQPALAPATPFNNNYRWEKTWKMELGLDLGFFKNKLLLGLALYQSRTGNQLLFQQAPAQTGFPRVMANFPAMVRNRGLEIELLATPLKNKTWKWTSSFNISFNRNKLLAYPGLERSSNATSMAIGEPITVLRGFHLKRVNPATGIYEVEDKDGNGVFNTADYISFGDAAPRYYGGLQQELSFKKYWRLSVFCSFKKQIGLNALSQYGVPAANANAPVYLLDNYWKQPGDIAKYQKLTRDPGSAAYTAATLYLAKSDAIYSDASYIRIKNIELAYTLKEKWLRRCSIKTATVYLQAQNFFTITGYQGADPENPQFIKLPPVRSLNIGVTVQW
ncbi:SusC/RagA family TonB-linked outer membrane protein [Filimonas effusa]|uniref:SusC/RagA family TonB-linked outer membrane protein n=1 Tax=Filimonas effusa TaxID=2508721 RepID=A0A4Q1D394_9BACT|nr:SusC/RagA family TonB-linked outer membrane protein [Filimonas effusa]RXK81769.1 SusC/RagA family TonB-linked outer membrane protein [Filimonas effusa]